MLYNLEYKRDWHQRLERQIIILRRIRLWFEEIRKYTHLKIASLVCILFSGELLDWLLNFDEMYLQNKKKIALINKLSLFLPRVYAF